MANIKYYSLNRIDKTKAKIRIVFGMRSNGKTTAGLLRGIDKRMETLTTTKDQIAYIRRWDDEIRPKNNISELFDGILKFYDLEAKSGGQYNTIIYKARKFYLAKVVDEKIASAKTEIEAEIPSLDGYATEEYVQNVISGKADISDIPSVTPYADSVKYDDTTHNIEFYHNGTGGTKVYELDASPFLVDGMVENVEIKDVTTTESYTNITDYTGHIFSGGATYNFVVNVQEGWLASNNNNIYFFEQAGGLGLIHIMSKNGGIEVYSEDGTATLSGNTIYVTVTGGTPFDTVEADAGYNLIDSIQAVYYESYLVISFNEDAKKEDISIPLTEIFDHSNYYNKTEVNGIVSGIDSDISAINRRVNSVSGTVSDIGNGLITLYNNFTGHTADTSIHLTSGDVQTQINNSISGKADNTEIYTYVGTSRINVSSATGVRRKAIDLNLPIYSGSGISSLSLGALIGTAQGGNQIKGNFSTGIGWGLKTENPSEVATGQFNISHTVGESTWGNSGNTLFSVGNGNYQGSEHNAFEVRQNGDIYISSGGTTSSVMIKLQDILKSLQDQIDALSGST